ncbi:MAG: hypothetical protein JWN04_232 [Myxococcaceae bacterium]|nr:hypothetical protein [Myxococcaceae bacterium]
MKLLVTGARDGRFDVYDWLVRWREKYGPPELFISGGIGVGRQAVLCAQAWAWPTRELLLMEEEWGTRDSASAGRLRNPRMVELAGVGSGNFGGLRSGNFGG